MNITQIRTAFHRRRMKIARKRRDKNCLKKDEKYHDIGKIPGYTWRRGRRLQHISP
jgi:hypothetical protein